MRIVWACAQVGTAAMISTPMSQEDFTIMVGEILAQLVLSDGWAKHGTTNEAQS